MNDKHPIDDLFREALTDFTIKPSDGAKKSFLKDAASLPATEKKKNSRLFLLISISTLIIAGLISIFFVFHKNPGESFTRNPKSVSIPDNNPKPAIIEHAVPVKNETAKTISKPVINRENRETQSPNTVSQTPSYRNMNTGTETLPVLQPSEITGITRQSTPDVHEPEKRSEPLDLVTPLEANGISVLQIPGNLFLVPSAYDSVATTTVPDMHPGISDRSGGDRINLSLGLSYSPEWMFNTLEGAKFVNNFAIEGLFHYGPFSIRTGVGLSIGKGTNEVKIEYNDYLGTYNKLDSIQFKWDTPTHQYLPTYYLSRKDVWDSLLRIEDAKIVKRYTYLQIPLIFGYTFYEREKFSAGFRIGPVMSALLTVKELSDPYDQGKNRVIRVNDISPEQVDLNWQVMTGLSAIYRFNDRFRFELEPSVRYYFNSVYEKPYNNAKPWSAGIRAGFLIDL